jgi:hypothetical protein
VANSATAGPAVKRPFYREQALLTAADLRAEQQYRIAMRRRHDIGAHVWGIVEGLGIAIGADQLVVEPGLAVDGYGRALIVPARVTVAAEMLYRLGDRVAVFLLYGLVAGAGPGGGNRGDGLCHSDRLYEEARLRLTGDGDGIVPRKPQGVAAIDLEFPPDRPPPDDPGREWPVLLATLRRGGASTPYTADLAGRPYVDLRGEVVTAPSGRARLQVGAEGLGDRRRLSVAAAGEGGEPFEQFSIAVDGTTTLFGDATFGSDLSLADAAAGDAARVVEFGAKSAPPDAALPWSVYRTPAPPANGPPQDQLRFEIGSPGDKGDPQNFAFAIGHAAADDFVPCLSMTADCTVTVRGTLTVGGQLLEGPVQPDPRDPRFQKAIIESWTAGIAAVAGRLNTIAATDLQVGIRPSTVTPDTPLTFGVDLTNAGRGTITNLHLYAVLAEGITVLQHAEIALRTTELGEGATVSAEHDSGIRLAAGAVVDLAVTAIGLGPTGYPIQARARALFTSTILQSPG